MRIAIGSDHTGLPLKKGIDDYLHALGYDVIDVGTNNLTAVDYPDYAEALSKLLVERKAERGILICGNGVGTSVAANKVPGIRAGLCHDTYSARQGVEHDGMNVLVLGGRVIGAELARELVKTFLAAQFTREERSRRQLEKINAIEGRYTRGIPRTDARKPPSAVIIRGNCEAVLFDMDGVITDTASIHAACWKAMFDEFLQEWARQTGQPFRPFDIASDYKLYVDGKPRYQGVRDFLHSRRITLPEGSPTDPPTAATACGLGNRKNELVNRRLAVGAKAYPGTVAFIMYIRRMGIKTAVVTSSGNCQAILRAAKVADLFDARVDGEVLIEYGLAGKPAPDSFLKAAEMLGVSPNRAVVVEDALAGVQAGAKGGFGLVIGVDRHGNPQPLKAHGADIVVSDLAELLAEAVPHPAQSAA